MDSSAHPEQLTLPGLAAPVAGRVREGRRSETGVALTDVLPIARVCVDVSPAHLDRLFDYTVPAAIIRDLDLLRPIYAQTASYGHFGRELPDFTWERTDRVDDLRAAARL